jgi:hypothetical protein
MSENLPYYNPKRQGRKHLKTLEKRDIFEFPGEDLSPEMLEEEGVLYRFDGRSASVNGDIETTDDSTAGNAAAFLDQEFGDEELEWAYALESGGDQYGVVAAYNDPENPNVIEDFDTHTKTAPSSILHIFDAREDSSQVDIKVERYSNGMREKLY